MKKKINYKRFDVMLFLVPIIIFLIGALTIYSASSRSLRADDTLAFKQFFWMGIGILSVFLVVRVDYYKFRDFAWPAYFVTLFFLILVLFMPARLGAHRWIPLGGFQFQPSEFAKLSVILVLSHFFANQRYEFFPRHKLWIPFLIVIVPFLLILKEPDLGTGLLLIPVLFSMLYLWGMRGKVLIWMVLAALFISPLGLNFLKEYQKARLMVFINPNADPLGAGYTIIQSKIAIGSGGIFGKGFMGGTQNQLNFLPERHTDFIFSVVAEEGGLAVSLLVLWLFMLIVKKGYSICQDTRDRFGYYLAGGISTMLAVQIVINIGMTMGLLPVVGMPLPLVSYGGSSVLITMLAIATLLNIKMYRPVF